MRSVDAATAHLDLTSDLDRRSFELPVLGADHLGDIAATPGADPQAQLRVAIAALSRSSLAAHKDLALITDRLVFSSDDTERYDREILTDGASCFSVGTCSRVEARDHVRQNTFLFDIPYTARASYRSVTLDDGSAAMVVRIWTPERATDEDMDTSMDQNYALWVYWSDPTTPSKTRLYVATWVSWSGAGLLSQEIYNDTATSGLQETFDKFDAHVEAK